MRISFVAGLVMLMAMAGCQDDRPGVLETTSCAGSVRVETATGPQCALRTRDAGKTCTSSNQCETYCLAKTATCAPTKPYFGCFIPLENGKPGVETCVK